MLLTPMKWVLSKEVLYHLLADGLHISTDKEALFFNFRAGDFLRRVACSVLREYLGSSCCTNISTSFSYPSPSGITEI